MTPRAVLRLSSLWSPCGGNKVQIGQSENDSSVAWMRCEGGDQKDDFLDYLLDQVRERTDDPVLWLCVDLGECNI